ncbi:cation:proton antiporter regulatory subunit [Nonomuraea sp. NPDC049309]|uniref:cation:proton antiporter regulatory subunit n=1 Tax=Nonomuraea sp. NPDC049309 TaxID=3364350 RepID=UPI00371E8300
MSHRTGRRDLVIYDAHDPDQACETVPLNDDEADALAELLGAPRIIRRLNELHREVEGLVSEKLPIPADSPYAGRPMGDAQVRTRTGASIVAVVRGAQIVASPGPDFVLAAGDVVVVVGSADSVQAVAGILADG